MEDILIEFQCYLNDKGLITNHDWDYEKMAQKFLKSKKQTSKNFIKSDVIGSLPHEFIKKFFSLSDGGVKQLEDHYEHWRKRQ